MASRVIIVLLAAVLVDSSLATSLTRKVNNCACQRNGNKYIQLAEHECEKFTQYDNITRLTHTHSCPPGLRFSAKSCVCVHTPEVACDGCGPLVCEVEGNKRFESLIALRRAGDCESANKITQEVLAGCVTKDGVALTLLNLRFRAADSEHNCTTIYAEGCERAIEFYNLLWVPESKGDIIGDNNARNFLCENNKEAQKCLKCVENSGCQLAGEFRNSLRETAAALCPHLQDFTCPADV